MIWENESDASLLFFIGLKDEDEEMGLAAWEEFYQRHVDYLYRACDRRGRRLIPEGGVESVVTDTFVRVYESAASTFTSLEDASEEEQERYVRAWLGRIANNIITDMYRGREDGSECHLEPNHWEDVSDRESTQGGTQRSEQVQIVCELLENLSDRDQQIVLARARFFDPDNPTRKIPRQYLDTLATTLSTTRENIRKVFSRFVAEVRARIQQSVNA